MQQDLYELLVFICAGTIEVSVAPKKEDPFGSESCRAE